MHDTSFEGYVDVGRDVWRIQCTECGLVADRIDSEELASFLTGLHRGIDGGAACTIGLVGTTHILDVETGHMLCGIENQSDRNEPFPDLATCLLCWKAWHLKIGTLPKGPRPV